MSNRRFFVLSVVVIAVWRAGLNAQENPSFARHVKPFLAKYCLECHNADKPKGELNLESYKTLKEGGAKGPVVVAGKPDESSLVLQVEGKAKPAMPPRKAKQPSRDEISVLRAWVAAGARDEAALASVMIPVIKPRGITNSAVTALSYNPQGSLLAVGLYQNVTLLDVASGDVVGKLAGQTEQVTGIAFSPDGAWLVVASGAPGVRGEIRVYSAVAGNRGVASPRLWTGHKDLIQTVAFSPDSKFLATAGYDRMIKLWDVVSGKELRTLKDHSDAIYGLAFSPDGRLLASAAADRAVKVWEIATGTRLYTLGESTDWLYGLAWSPDGKHIAAGGVDKSIRIWQVSYQAGKLVNSVFAHEGSILRLAYSTDGKTLYSLSEDQTLKAWDAARMVERKVYAKQPEVVLALAVRPDHKQLALGRYDGQVLLLDEGSGQVQSVPIPVPLKPPQVTKVSPAFGERGKKIVLHFEGKYLDKATEFVANIAGVAEQARVVEARPQSAVVEVALPAGTPAGKYQIGLRNSAGSSAMLPFTVDLFPLVEERDSNNAPRTGQKVTLPVSLAGKIEREGDADFFRFDLEKSQSIGVECLTKALGSTLEPVLQVTDIDGNVLAVSMNGVLGFTALQAGHYALGIRDQEYRGGNQMDYRIHVGEIPVVTRVFPLGLQAGTEVDVQLHGVFLGNQRSVRIKAATTAAAGTKLPVAVHTPWGEALGNPTLTVNEFAEVFRKGPEVAEIPVPGIANGILEHLWSAETWKFRAKKGQRLILETNAQRVGSPLDSYLEVVGADGKVVPRATLRCTAKTYVTFRDHPASAAGIRIESWSELAVNDFLYAGSELIRIRNLPRNPDDDCTFFSEGGQRKTYMESTPTHLSMGTPMYKVGIFPPGTSFAPNGLPVINLTYRNDDGGKGYGKDSRIFFDPPADGEYFVRVGDSRGAGTSPSSTQGEGGGPYQLTVRQPKPHFSVSFNPTAPAVWKGGAVPVNVAVERFDGFEERVEIELENLPAGFSAPATTVTEGDNDTTFALWADANATIPPSASPLKLKASAWIGGKKVVQEVQGGLPKLVEPGDLVTRTEQSEVSVVPGGQVVVTAKIERRKGFSGRVPLDVRGLPHGVRVLDIGLNGILITEKDSSRAFVIYAEPWVKPMSHPFVVLARREGKGTEHAAKSVLLKVAGEGSR